MTTKPSELTPISCSAGVEPSTDRTLLSTQHYTFADKIRFVNGMPKKIGGWQGVSFESAGVIAGAARTVFSITIANQVITLIGTEQKLYSLIGSQLINITPLKVATTVIANSLDTHYDTLAGNPITTVNGSSTVTITDAAAANYQAGDIITLSGATGFAGILAGAFNTAHIIRSIGTGNYTINVGTVANASTTGGGALVVRTSGLITVNAAAHGQINGDRTKITLAADVGGVLAAAINKEWIIRNVTTNTFDIYTLGTATSSVSAGGGASTAYQIEIDDGRLDASLGQGYGMGKYGVGLYGVSKISSGGVLSPRIWFCDMYGEIAILTAGNQSGLYSWSGNTATAPTLISGAPAVINYAFVSNNIVVTFGAAGKGNHIFASDIDDFTQWIASSTNQVFEDFIETASTFLSHVHVSGINLIFTPNSTYTFRYIGLPNVWEIKLKSASFGIIAAMARCEVNDTAYWMGNNNFYMWNGGNVEVIPSNSQKQSTILRYVFDNLNFSQKSKCFAWYNSDFNEVWFHYPSAASSECDRIARLCLFDYSWVMDTMSRAGAEYPDVLLFKPRLSKYASGYSTLFRHEVGTDDDIISLPWSLTTNLRTNGKDTTTAVGVIPDSTQGGNVALRFDGYQFPQSTNTTYSVSYSVTPTTERITTQLNGRCWKYTFSGDALGQAWQMGKWQEYLQMGATN